MKELKKYSLVLLLLLPYAYAGDNQQEGSLNTHNGDGSTVNSNNNTQDESVSNTYNGAGSSSEIPVGSAIAPSYISNGLETCLRGSARSLQTGLVGYSSGLYKEDEDCNRRRDSKMLADLGMKVAAIGRLCQSDEVWRSMFVSGTPCPILKNGRLIVGKRAFLIMKMQPETYIPDYEDKEDWYNNILGIGEQVNEEIEQDTQSVSSVSSRFRSSEQ
jgi:hypothetical protein